MEEATRESAPPPADDVRKGRFTRRAFIKGLLGVSVISMASMIVAPIVGFLIPPKQEASGPGGKVLAGTTADIPVGSGTVVAMGSSPVVVVNTNDGVKAYSAVCTHLGCIVEFDQAAQQINCPCHGGRFNPGNVAVTAGPPPKALPPVTVEVEKDQIFLVAG